MNTSFWILLTLGLLLIMAAIATKAIWFFTAEPKVTVDYLVEYNKISKPDGFDPNDNADELYKKAYEVYVQPSEVYEGDYERVIMAREALRWFYLSSKDINEEDKTSLKKWFEKNSRCMEYLKEGNRKKFFWVELNVRPDVWEEKDYTAKKDEKKNENMSWPISQGARLFEERAKVAAMDGRFEDALIDLIECWKIGHNCTNPNLFWTQQTFAMQTEEQAIEAAFQILDRFKLDANTLKLWQESWQKVFNEDKYRPGFKTDRLIWCGYIQKYFAYHPKGKGRLAWKKAKEFDHFHPILPMPDEGSRRRWPWGKEKDFHQEFEREGPNPRYSCFFGPTSNEAKGLIDYFFGHYESYKDNTPWYEYYPEKKFQSEIEEWKTKHPFPKQFFYPGLKPDWVYYHRLKAKSDALVTVIALLRFKADHGHYPKNLEMLKPRDGFRYLEKLPQDPFSEGPLVYHWLVDDFELYSLGPDFKDDGGKRTHDSYPLSGDNKGDDVFWPPFRLNRENVKFMSSKDRPEP
jgi:hypothetical protein